MGLIRLIEIFRKKVTQQVEKGHNVYFQDADNLYPNRVKGLIEDSPTAFRSSLLMAKFIVGSGLTDQTLYDKIIDKTLNLDVYSFSHVLAKSIAMQNGYFVHITYKFENNLIVPSYSKVIPFEYCRISKDDENGYIGKLLVSDWTDEDDSLTSQKDNTIKTLYPFTKNQNDLKAQIVDFWSKIKPNDEFNLIEAIKVFKGQYYYYNPNIGNVYPLAKIHPVMNDCDTEYRMSNYTNICFRLGMLGKTVIHTNNLTEEQEEQIYKVFEDFLGDETVGNMAFIPVNLPDDRTFDDAVKITQLKPQYDEDFMEKTKVNVRKNIMAQFNNIPEALVMASDGSLFGTSGDTYNEMKLFYSEQNDEERRAVQKFFKDVYDIEVEFDTFGVKTVTND